jgi:hypothetical protein
MSGTGVVAKTLAFFIDVAEPSKGTSPGDILAELSPVQMISVPI